MTKAEFIRSQRALYPDESIPNFVIILNTPVLMDNPAPQATVPKQITIEQAKALVPDAEAFAISETRTYDRLLDAFGQKRMDWVADNIRTLVAGGVMSVETATALSALMAQTELDPNWESQVVLSPSMAAGFVVIDTTDVMEALNL